MAVEENKKIILAKEAFTHLYTIADEYRTITERQKQELQTKNQEIDNLKKEIEDLKKSKNIDILLNEIHSEKDHEIQEKQKIVEEKQKIIDNYLKDISNTIDKLEKKSKNILDMDSTFQNFDEKIDKQLSQISQICTDIEGVKENVIKILRNFPESERDEIPQVETDNLELERESEGKPENDESFGNFAEDQRPNNGYCNDNE